MSDTETTDVAEPASDGSPDAGTIKDLRRRTQAFLVRPMAHAFTDSYMATMNEAAGLLREWEAAAERWRAER